MANKIHSQIKLLTQKELRKQLNENTLKDHTLVFYSFYGSKDFDFIYPLTNPVVLLLHEEEVTCYQAKWQQHKQQLEVETNASHRVELCRYSIRSAADRSSESKPNIGRGD